MYIEHRRLGRQFKILGLLVSLVAASAPVRAELLVFFDFDDAAGEFENAADVAAAGLTVGGWSDRDGTLAHFAGNPGRALAASSFFDGNALQVRIDVAPGLRVDVGGYAFDQRVSTQGPTTWALSIASVPVATGPTTLSFAAHAGVPALLTGLSGAFDVVLAGASAATSTGTLRIDNFRLTGQIAPVPLPCSLLLLGSSGVLLTALRRRA